MRSLALRPPGATVASADNFPSLLTMASSPGVPGRLTEATRVESTAPPAVTVTPLVRASRFTTTSLGFSALASGLTNCRAVTAAGGGAASPLRKASNKRSEARPSPTSPCGSRSRQRSPADAGNLVQPLTCSATTPGRAMSWAGCASQARNAGKRSAPLTAPGVAAVSLGQAQCAGLLQLDPSKTQAGQFSMEAVGRPARFSTRPLVANAKSSLICK